MKKKIETRNKIQLSATVVRHLTDQQASAALGGGSLDCTVPTHKTSVGQLAAC